MVDNSLKRAKTRGKRAVQAQKECERRRKLRELIQNALDQKGRVSESELAVQLDVSQATVSRDLKKLGKSRWNPYRLYEIGLIRKIRANEQQRRENLQAVVDGMGFAEGLKMLGAFMRKPGGHSYPSRSKSRGKSFSSTYQP